jgi:hypothetical protein
MAKHPNFRPMVGSYWSETVSDDSLILNELRRLGLSQHLKQSKTDLTQYGINKRLVLRHITGQAILVWEKQRLPKKKYGIRCLFFVNNSQTKSAELLEEAMKLARWCWIEYSFFAHVDSKLFPKNAERIFRKCGWKRKGKTSNGVPIYISDSGISIIGK